jgi:beta-lactam-binding protein with PASTA domain
MEAESTPPVPQKSGRRGPGWVLIVAVVAVAVGAIAAVLFFWPENKERITVPDVVGLSTQSTERVLDAAGLALGDEQHISVEEGAAETGTVLSRAPSAGTEVDAGAQVALVVA